MKPIFRNGNVISRCPDCGGAVTTFEQTQGFIACDGSHFWTDGQTYSRLLYILMKCASCQRAGVAKIHDNGRVSDGVMEWFFPKAIERASIPAGVPSGIQAEYREAELCASVDAWRAASGLLRSTLEKVLRANGYNKGSLAARIDEAAADGIITESRRRRAHEDIRVLGNDVLHDEWRMVDADEVIDSHHYLQRIMEDFYDDRDAVEAILVARGRLAPASAA